MAAGMRNQSLRHLLTICGYRVRRVLADRGSLFWLLVLPLALVGILGMGLQGLMSSDFIPARPFRVVLVETGAGVPAWLAEPLGSMPNHLAVVTAGSAEEARAMVARREADAAVLVGEDGTGQGTGYSGGQGTDQSTNQSTGQSTGQGTGQSTGQRTDQTTGQSTGQSTDQRTDQTTGQRTDQSTGQSTGQGTGHDTGQSPGQGIGHDVGQGSGVPAVTLVAPPGAVVTEMLTAVLNRLLVEAGAGGADPADRPSAPAMPGEERNLSQPASADAGASSANGLPTWLQTDAYTYYAIAVMAMFVMFAAHAVGAGAARERTNDAYARLRALGVQPVTYMLSGSVASVLVSCLFLSVMAVISRALFGVQWGNVLTWGVLTLAGAAAAAGLSLVVLALIPKPEQVDGAGSAIFNVLAFLGGSMMPLHVLPEWFRTSLAWLPSRAVLTGYLKAAQGADPAAVSGELRTLLLAAVVLFAAGWAIWTMRAKEEA